MLEKTSLELLKTSKNLLAFSAGVDSTALLFLLLEHNVSFDIAIVDYGIRLQSKEEVSYAQELAKEHNFTCFVHKAQAIESNFEAKAREIRYSFFETLITEHAYETLLTAHHLGDRLEWMLMQFCKGAGCVELSGMKKVQKRDFYTLYRPLLHLDKSELLAYLQTEDKKYFLDESNEQLKYKRNEFRHNYAKPMIQEYLSGIKKSFEYIDEDVSLLIDEIEVGEINAFAYFKTSHSKRSDGVAIDKYLKSKGHIITAKERELLKAQESVVLGRKYVVNQTLAYVFIAPYIQVTQMTKEFKEKMRLLKIEPKLRAYLSTDSEAVALVSRLLQ